MANFSTAFGYDVYIMPLTAASVDVTFAGYTQAIGLASAGAFLATDTTCLLYTSPSPRDS